MMPALVDSGVRRFRIELVDEPASAVAPLLQAYQQVSRASNEGGSHTPTHRHTHPPAWAPPYALTFASCAFRQVAREPSRAREAWSWLQTLPDGNGNAQGVTLGSLEHKQDLARPDLKLTKTRQLYGQPGAEVQGQKKVLLRERRAGGEGQPIGGQPRGQDGGGRVRQRKARGASRRGAGGARRGRGAARTEARW